jgi:peptidoglycan/xylan/chitin deacetylase (PgdA/CDA1 family)
MASLAERMEQRSGHGLAEIFADDPWSGLLTWDEVRQAPPEVHFGSHGVNHPLLSLVSPAVARQELVISREAIEFYTGRPCVHFAYPNGSFNIEVASLVRNCNYSSAVTTIAGLNRPGDEMLTLRRISFPRTDSQAGIIAAVSGLSSQWQKLSRTINYPHSESKKETR